MNTQKQKILIVGGGGHARSCIDVIESTKLYDIVGIIDQNTKGQILGYDVLGGDDMLGKLIDNVQNAVICVGQIKNSGLRIQIYENLKNLGYNLPIIISPLAYVSRSATIGEGSIVMHHSLINSNVKVGKACIINTKALLEHDVCVGDFCHISTAAVLNGSVEIGDNTFIGSNMVLRQNTKISQNSIIYSNFLESDSNFKKAIFK